MGPATRRRWTAFALAVLLTTSACGKGDKDPGGEGPPPTNPDGSPAETVPADDGTGNPPPGGGTSGPSSTATTGRPNAQSPPTSSTPTTTRTQTRAPNAPDSGARGGPGAFARTLLRPQPATRIVVELQVQAGAEPRQGSIDHLLKVLREESRKQVVLAEPVTLPAGDGTATADDIRTWADRYGKAQQGGEQAVVRVQYLTGTYSEKTDDPDDEDGAEAIGVAVRGDTMAIFKETVRRAASPIVGAATIEDAVIVHEMGHLLGLVDIVLKTGRQDPDNPGHSRNRDSVMYWAVESRLVGQALGGPPSRNFDAADKADLDALRNGA